QRSPLLAPTWRESPGALRAIGAGAQAHREKDSHTLDIHAHTSPRRYQSSSDHGSTHPGYWPSSPARPDCDSYCRSQSAPHGRVWYRVPEPPTTSSTQRSLPERGREPCESDQPARLPLLSLLVLVRNESANRRVTEFTLTRHAKLLAVS